MKRFTTISILLLLILTVYWGFKSAMPSYTADLDAPATSFSTDRAMMHVEKIAATPHGVGFEGHTKVREYIVSELQKLGLETSLQEGKTAGDWANLSEVTNIMAKIKGSRQGKALLLLSHYDSSSHSSLGASDAGSGVATILEGVRAYLAANPSPKNDIIILISDAEELGLNGANLFVNQHPWAKNVGLVLNFEARGSGGPGYMLIETNRKNGRLIQEFLKANPEYPVTNSLAYSVYKMFPNDTDLTIFREDGDIEGFNFAFIDDHYDYHTAKDTPARLDKNTLAHQGSYLMPLLTHFSNASLDKLKSLNDSIYFNVPFFKLVSYPFEWIWPMFALATLLFIVLLIHGFRKKELHIAAIGKAFLPLLITLLINGVVGFYGWRVLKWIYPQYKDIFHGFPYNGHTYIMAFTLFSIAICFWSYHKFRKLSTANLLVAPILIWLLICGAIVMYLPGASFFIIPIFALLAAFMVILNQEKPNPYLLLFLAIPALWICGPLVKMFPVGLGLKMMIAATLMTTLLFFLTLPIFGFFRNKNRLAYLSFVLFFGFMIGAHLNSGFSETSAKPTSLLYVHNANTNTAQWATYENELSSWTSQYLGTKKQTPEALAENTISSKYSTGFSYVAPAQLKEILLPKIEKNSDTIVGNERILDICITPQRNVNRLEIYTNDVAFNKVVVNDIPLSEYYLEHRSARLLTHYITDNAYTELQLRLPKDAPLSLTFYEASNDLLHNPLFSVPPRPKDNIPMPFVLNDAILTIKTVQF